MSEALTERIIIPMGESLVTAIDDFRFANRMPSRAEAIRHLLLTGLSAKATTPAPPVPLSALLLAAYKSRPTEQLGFEQGIDPAEAVALEFPPYPKRRANHLDTFEISTLIKTAIRQVEIWEDMGGPEAAAICDVLRPLTR